MAWGLLLLIASKPFGPSAEPSLQGSIVSWLSCIPSFDIPCIKFVVFHFLWCIIFICFTLFNDACWHSRVCKGKFWCSLDCFYHTIVVLHLGIIGYIWQWFNNCAACLTNTISKISSFIYVIFLLWDSLKECCYSQYLIQSILSCAFL